MVSQLRVFAWINIWMGAFSILAGLSVLCFSGGTGALLNTLAGLGVAHPILAASGNRVLAIFCVLASPDLILGLGLLWGAPWARTLGLLLSVLELPGFPVGTAIGLFGLWVLNGDEVRARGCRPQLFQSPSRLPRYIY